MINDTSLNQNRKFSGYVPPSDETTVDDEKKKKKRSFTFEEFTARDKNAESPEQPESQPQKRSFTFEEFTGQKPETGYIEGVGRSLYRGVADIGTQAGKAMQYNADYLGSGTDTPESRDESKLNTMNKVGKTIADTSEKVKNFVAPANFGQNEVKRSVFQGVESAPVSVAYAVPGFVGAGIGAATGLADAGTTSIPGAIAGAAAGQAVSGPIMYRAQAQQASEDLDKLQQEGKIKSGTTNADKLANAQESGFHEAFGEGVSDVAENVLFSRLPFLKATAKTAKEAIRPGLKEFAKAYAGTWASEQAGEGYTAAMQANAQNKIVTPDAQQSPWEAAKQQAGPTTVMSLLMFGAGAGGSHYRGSKAAKTLESVEANQDDRLKAAGYIGSIIHETNGPEAAKNFLEHAADAISNPSTPQSIDLNNPALLDPYAKQGDQQEQTPVVQENKFPVPAEPPQPVKITPPGTVSKAIGNTEPTVEPITPETESAGLVDKAVRKAAGTAGPIVSESPVTLDSLQQEKANEYNQLQNTKEQRRQFVGTVPPAVDESAYLRQKPKNEIAAEEAIKSLFDNSYNLEGAPKIDYISDQEAQDFADKSLGQLQRKQWADANKKYHSQVKKDEETIKSADIPAEVKRDARKQADEIVNADPVYAHMADAKKRGGLNLEAFKQDYDKTSVADIMRRYPGIFSRIGTIKPDEFAAENGYASLDDMVQRFSHAKTKRELQASVLRDLHGQWKDAELAMRENTDNEGRKTWAGQTKPEIKSPRTSYPATAEDMQQSIRVVRQDPENASDVIDHWSFSPEQRQQLVAARDEALNKLSGGEKNADSEGTVAGSGQEVRNAVSQGAVDETGVSGTGSASKESASDVGRRPVSAGGQEDRTTGQTNHEVINNPSSAAHQQEVNTSPSKAQADAGNYKKAHVNIDGMDVSIENPAGSTRSGTDQTGKEWSTTMKTDYGYIKGSVGYDKDHVDVFIAPGYKGGAKDVYVVNQHKNNGHFDEHKAVIGAKSEDEAMKIYNSNYEKGWKGGKSVAQMPMEEFKTWVKSNGPKKGAVIHQGEKVNQAEVKNKPQPQEKSNVQEKGRRRETLLEKPADQPSVETVTGPSKTAAPANVEEKPLSAIEREASRMEFTTIDGSTEFLVRMPKREGGYTNFARFSANSKGKPIQIRQFYESKGTRDSVLLALERFSLDENSSNKTVTPNTREKFSIGDLVEPVRDKDVLKPGTITHIQTDYDTGEQRIRLEGGGPHWNGTDYRKITEKESKQPAEGEKHGTGKENRKSEPTGVTPSVQIAKQVKENLSKGERISARELFRWSDEAYQGSQSEGKYTPKDSYDALELGINQYLADGFKFKSEDPAERIKELEHLLSLVPTQTKRTAEQDAMQQYSTVPTLAYVAEWAANVKKNDSVLEPSAGIGGIAVFAKIDGAKDITVNELSERRRDILKNMGFDHVYGENAEQLNNVLPDTVKPTVVLMNPPFSATAGRMSKNNTAYGAQHIEQALKRLEPGGRLVAIVGEGMAAGKPTFTKWWSNISKEYTVKANIGINGEGYRKYGTTFDNQILVIDKTGPTTDTIITGKVNSYADLIPLLKEVRYARAVTTQRPANKQDSKTAIAEGGANAESITPLSSTTPYNGVGQGNTANRPGSRGQDRADAAVEPGILDGSGNKPEPGDRNTSKASEGRHPTGKTGVDDSRQDREPAPRADLLETSRQEQSGNSQVEGYQPTVVISGAKPHPADLVESAAMSAVRLPEISYQPKLPKETVTSGKLSSVQLEAIAAAGHAHQEILPNGERRGFFIGDGTGVGKGREIAGILWDNWNQGRKKSIWVSKDRTLAKDAKRDMNGIGWKSDNLFEQGSIKAGNALPSRDGVAFTAYSTLSSAAKQNQLSRLDALIQWAGPNFDGVIAFDESHKMGNAVAIKEGRFSKKPSQMALAALDLQKALPKARVVYVSATGATEVSNLAYANRLGLWGEGTPFQDVHTFIGKIAQGGIAAMEVVARDMKSMGSYLARKLAFNGQHKAYQVKYRRLEHELNSQQREVYDELATSWQIVLNNIDQALQITDADSNGKSHALSAFWGAHQRFFNQVLTAMQMPSVISSIRNDIKDGKAIVLQITNTNEASTTRALAKADNLEDVDITPRDQLMQMIENSFPVQQYEKYEDEDGNERTRPVVDSNGNPVLNREAVQKREELLNKLGSIRVPDSPLDQILDTFGVDNVAEVTGRSKRIVTINDGKGAKKVRQSWSKVKGVADAAQFMDGKKDILIFSEAGGTGASYHADLKAKNQKQRSHYILQAGWRAYSAIQGLGRSHRSNQAVAPEYVLVTTDLKGHKRFISSIARRLSQLGALTEGERKASSQGLFTERDNLESEYAADAVTRLIHNVARGVVPGMDIGSLSQELGLPGLIDDHGQLNASKIPTVPRFLNRILSMRIDSQNKVFDLFSKYLDENVTRAEENGTLDQGLETLKAKEIRIVDSQPVYTDKKSGATTNYVQLDADYLTPKEKYNPNQKVAVNNKSNTPWQILAEKTVTNDKGEIVDVVVLKNGRGNIQKVKKEDFKAKFNVIASNAEARAIWDKGLSEIPDVTTKREHLITGALLPIWDKLIGHPRIVRVQTDKETMLGRLINDEDLSEVMARLDVEGKAIEMSPKQAVSAVINDGKTLTLDNGWKIKRSRVADENRIEIVGANWKDLQNLQNAGAFTERINYITRLFIPTGEKGNSVMEKVLAYKKILTAAKGNRTSEGETKFSTNTDKETGTNLSELTPSQRRVVDSLTDIGNVQIISNETALRKLARAGEDISVFGDMAKPEGFVLNGKTYIVPENSKEGRLWGVFRHEAGVHVGQAMQDDQGFQRLLSSIESRRDEQSPTGEAIRAAEKLVPKNTKPENRTEEILSYMVRDAKDVGIVRRFIAMVKRVLVKLGKIGKFRFDPNIFTVDDLAALADMAVRREARGTTGGNSVVGMNEFAKDAKMSIGRAKRIIQGLPAFKKWFGESKVVDENGAPLVVYHGTRTNPEKFKVINGMSGHFGTYDAANDKIHFDIYEQGLKGNASIIPVFLSMKNPVRMSDVHFDEYGTMAEDLVDRKVLRKNDLPSPWGKRFEVNNNKSIVSLIDILKSKGYDGIVYENKIESKGTDSYIPFSPTQIKSIYNRGTWDGNNPNIMFSVNQIFKKVTRELINSPSFQKWFGDSKITANGEPSILYHGTPHNQFLSDPSYDWIFDTNRPIKPDSSPFAGLGIFLGNDTIAGAHAGYEGTVHPFFVRVENPLVITSAELEKKVTDLESAKTFKKRTQELGGHDGIIIKDRGQVIAFDANQLKSADINTGEFSRQNNDVRFSIGTSTHEMQSSTVTTDLNTGKYSLIHPFTGPLSRALSTAVTWAKGPDVSKRFEKLATYLWDQDAAISRVQNEIGPQPERLDYNLMRRLTGKSIADEVQRFTHDRLNPIIKAVADAKVSIQDVEQLAWAEHAPERNLQMKRVNARGYIDNMLKNYTDAERVKYDEILSNINDDVIMNDRTRNDRRDQYIILMDGLSRESQTTATAQLAVLDDMQKALDTREFTDEEIEKGKPERLQKRIDNARERLQNRIDIAEKWEDRKDRLSGMTNQESQDIVDKWKQDKRYQGIRKVVDDLRAINEAALDMNYHAGELTEDEYKAIKNTYQYHVPLFREDADSDKAPTGRQGIGPLASPIKIAAGSTKKAVDIFSHVIDRYQSAIQRKHKLAAGKVLYNMVAENPDDSRWSITQLEKKPYLDNEGNIRFYPDQILGDSEVYVKVDGVKHIIAVPKDNEPMMRWMEALKREPAPLGPLLTASGKITRTLAKLNTSLSMEFMVGNFFRDLQEAGINMESTQAAGMQKTVLKNIASAIKGIYRDERGKDSGEWGKVYREFAANGGKIGWMQNYEDVKALGKTLEEELAYQSGQRPKRAKVREIGRWVEAMNTSVENGVRLSVYKALRDSGVSVKKAALVTSNLTVDFTRHGTAGPSINALYMFANAGIQGNVRMFKAISGSKTVRRIVGGIVAFGAGVSMLGAYAGGNDDDGESYYDKLKRTRPYLFEHNVVIMLPGTKGDFIKFPMPYGYNMFFALGDEAATAYRGGPGYHASEGMGRVMSTFMNAFNPLQSATLLQTVMPTIGDPIAYIAENKGYDGRPLMPDKNPFGIPKPDSERYFKSVNPVAKYATEWVNSHTGGNKVKPGLIDVSPEVIDMLADTLAGSLGKMVKDTISLPISIASKEPVDARKIPVVRRFYGEKSDTDDMTIFKKNHEEIAQFAAEYKISDLGEKAVLRNDSKFQMLMIDKTIESRLKVLHKHLATAEKNNRTDRVEQIKAQINTLYDTYNSKYNALVI